MGNESRVIITADSAQAIREFNRLRTESTASLRDIASYSDKIGAALGAIGLGTGLAAIVGMSDEYTKFTAQLRLATVSQNEYNAAYADVKRIATGSQQSLAGTGTLYARIANGTRELGTTQKQVADITETVNLALKVSGATATESASAQLQLSQAFASGTLRGEEFNAVNEAAPRLMKALADGMGLPIGALKGLAGEGKITSQIMADVLPKALGALQEEGKKIATIGGALTVLKDEFMELTAVKAQANGTVSALTTGIRLLSDNMAILMGTITTLTAAKLGTWMGKWVTDTYAATVANKAAAASSLALAVTTTEASAVAAAAKLTEARAASTATGAAAALATARVAELRTAIAAADGEVMLAIALNGLIPAEARATALAEAHAVALAAETAAATAATRATTAATVALSAQAAAATLATRAMGVLRGIMAFMGGPIGTIITLLGAAAMAWSHYSNKAKESSKEAAGAVAETTSEMIERLDKEIAKLKERNALRNALPIAKQMNEADQNGLRAAKQNMEDAMNGVGRFSLRSKDSLARLIPQLTATYNEALEKAGEKAKETEIEKAGTVSEKITKWRAENGSAKERMDAELDKMRKDWGTIPADIEVKVRAKYEDKSAAAALNKEQTAYDNLIASIRTKTAENTLEAKTDQNATESQKMRIKLDEVLGTGKRALSAAHRELAKDAIADLAASEAALKAREQEKDVQDSLLESTTARASSTAALAAEYAMYGKSSDARALEMIAVKAQADQEKYLVDAKIKGKIVTGEQIKDLTAEKDARVLVEQATVAQTTALNYAHQLKEENKKFGIEYILDDKARAAALLKIDAAMWQERITLAGVGTDAQKRLQEEYSTWYNNQLAKPELEANKKMWDSIDTTAHDTFVSIFDSGKSAFDRLRDTLKNGLLDLLYQMTIKKWILTIGASVSGAGAAGLASAEGLGLTGGASGVGLGGVTSLAQSAKTAYTIATQGFSGVAAGIGGSIATLGNLFGSSAVSAFGAGMGMTGAQAAAASAAYGSAGMASTGTALTSGAFAGAAVTAAAGIAAGVLGGKLISGQYGSNATVIGGTGIGAVAGAFLGGPVGAAIGGALGGVIGGIGNRFFGMGDKKYGETGITGTLSGSGFTGNEYANWTQKGGWFRSDKKDTDRKAVDTTTSNAFVETYAAIRNVSSTLANTLGVDTSSLATRAQALNINLTGLTTEADRLGAVTKFFEGVGNAIALELVPSLGQFKVGNEELSTTLQRVAGDYAGVDASLQLIGRTSQDAFGAVGVATIGARENLIKLAGSLDSLTSGTSFFAENFLTEAEQMAPVLSTVADTLGRLGMAGTTTMEDYKKKVLGLNLASAADQELYIKLLALAPAFKAASDYSNQLAAATGNYAAVVKSASEIASEHMDLQKQLNELTKSEAELLAIQRSSIASVNRALFDQVQAAKAVVSAKDALGKAYDREAAAAQTALDKSKSWVSTLNGLNASMALGSQSILTPEQKYAEARAQFEKTLAAANAGDTTAQSGLSAAEQAFLTASQVVNASDARYAADYARVLAANDEALKWASAQVDVQQASLDALKAQVSGLITINDSVLTVAQAIANLHAAMGTATGLGVEFTNAPAVAAPVAFSSAPAPVVFDTMRYSAGSNVGSDALVAEIRALNTRLDAQTVEIKGLRADQAKQTGATIQATVESNDKAAKTVVAGVDKSSKSAVWNRKVEYAA